MKNFKVLTKTELQKISGGYSCGMNVYDTHGERIEEVRGISKAEAQAAVSSWNNNHDSYCTSECHATAKWCCASC